MTKNKQPQMIPILGGQGQALNVACSPYSFLEDCFKEFSINPEKNKEAFMQTISANNLEYEYELFKQGISIDRKIIELISLIYGNESFWWNVSLQYLSYIASIHFSTKFKKIKKGSK